ncbi:hypothetical protein M8542_18520 [Amycolatopsis sp. OK19-0408]|uniref:Uncharacterized protein n=1 Tax=Amycolatopsis iheyensis TaxID=2945988 RepID=A0A9X2NBM9_9PSEU|nr:hypothetical protein [Amycolatopsis iheyensis]MCR6484827.1 hypothetical protein [Amycolatopsis iheyensis]
MRIAPAVAAALLVTGLTAGTANATIVTNTGMLTYNCTFPGVTPQPTTLVAHLDVTDPHPGQPFTVTPYATVTYSAAVKALLGALGYDQVRGSISTTFSVVNATPPTGVLAGALPANPFTSGSVTGTPQVFTADAVAGSVSFAMGTGISESLEFHKKATGTWTAFASTCTIKATSPAQNRAFQPDVPIT